MAWEKASLKKLAKELGINQDEVREKQRLMQLIAKQRKKRGMSQAKLAMLLDVTQSRIAQIESGIGTATVSFDVLLRVLDRLGYDYRIVTREREVA